jgi:hypothetical protein
MRRAAKTDANHKTIVAAFRAMGCSVQSLAAVGKGVPDLLVAFAGLNFLVEIKDGSKPKSQRQFTKPQVVWASTWRAPRHLVESVEDVQRLVKAWRTAAEPSRIVMRWDDRDGPVPAFEPGHIEWLPAPHAHSPMASDVECDASDYERPEVVEPSKLRKAGL